MGQFDKYAKLYARRKDLLFPLLQKYSGKDLRGSTHGEAIAVYLNLLKTNPAFAAEVEALTTKSGYNNAVPVVGGIISGVLGLFSGTQQDAAFAGAVLEEQKAKNTQTLLIVGGITLVSLALIGLGIYMAVNKKR
jgi:hypothetical protein